MIVKTNRDGAFYVADGGGWRVAGPFASNDEAWAYIDQQNEANEPRPKTLRKRQPRTNTDLSKADARAVGTQMLESGKLSQKESGFVRHVQKIAERKTNELRLTERQANWWNALVKRMEA